MRTVLSLAILTAVQSAAWCATPRAAEGDAWTRAPERLLTTPTAIIRFGWTARNADDLMAELTSAAEPQVVVASAPGILEYACTPESIILWGAPLFRIYEDDLLTDLSAAERAAARLGDRPFVLAQRRVTRSRGSLIVAFPPPILPQRLQPAPSTPLLTQSPEPPRPTVALPQPETLAPRPRVSMPAPAPMPAAPDAANTEAAAQRLSSAEERIAGLRIVLETTKGELAAAEQAAAPQREDVAARRKLFEDGVIARNAVKAAEQQLNSAEAGVAAAKARVSEAEAALSAAEAERDAALAGLSAAKKPPAPAPPPKAVPEPEPAPVAVVADQPKPRPQVFVDAPTRTEAPSRRPAPEPALDFPAPTVAGGPAPLPDLPPLEDAVRLRTRGDVPEGSAGDGPLPLPTGTEDLARRRWLEETARNQGIVSRAFLPEGSRVAEGDPVVELLPTSVARLRAEVEEEHVGLCRVGLPVEVAFPEWGRTYRGWIASVEASRWPRPPGAQVEIYLTEAWVARDPVYPSIEWMALSSPTLPGVAQPFAYREETEPTAATNVGRFFPLDPTALATVTASVPEDGRLSGSMELVSSVRPSGFDTDDPEAKAKLQRLQQWRESFIEGMKTTVFPETDLTLTYPREGDVTRAVERMATRRVSHRPNLCAQTLREALGWGLGDAAMWARRLPDRGYRLREDSVARPGDILVWPFTYGASRAQHVGVAVAQGGTVMLLSNEGGTLGTTHIKPGYLAFHKPLPKPEGEPAEPAMSLAGTGSAKIG